MTYQPTLESVKTHPMPNWYNDARFGIFIHWGMYSVPAFAPHGELTAEKLISGQLGFAESPYAEWYQNSLRLKGSPTHQYHAKTYGADFRYEQFAPMFNEQLPKWNPDEWADLFSNAGARYVVLVTKHHDGFLMWNSKHPNPRNQNWQAVRDVAGELNQAVNAKGMKMGFYYSSLLDWSFTKTPINSLAELIASSDTSREYLTYIENHWRELIERYDPWILWSDIGYPPGFELPKLFADFYNRKPDGVVNDRWMQLPKFFFNKFGRSILTQMIKRMGQGELKVPHSDFSTPEYAMLDHIAPHKWETCRGIGNSFGYNQFEDADDYQKADDLIRLLADIVSKNGNLLLNVGPRADGSLHPQQVEALEGLGTWLKANGESIYGTHPWIRFSDSSVKGAEVRYTSKGDSLYVIVTTMPADGIIAFPKEVEGSVTLLETGASLKVERSADKVFVTLSVESKIPVLKIQK
ncbi:MAG: alpha-L-fucosidase [Chloroflexota bacterium]